MKRQTKRVAGYLSIVGVMYVSACGNYVINASAQGMVNVDSFATFSMAHVEKASGTVKKSEPLTNSESFSPFIECKEKDLLPEGSLIQTGIKSIAQIKWQNVTSRIWANSLVRIEPGKKTVFLDKGELLFKKDSGSHGIQIVETKRLQARIHGTTINFYCDSIEDKVSVLEGIIEVRNKLDGSIVKLTPGVVYTVRGKIIKSTSIDQFIASADLKNESSSAELIFHDKASISIVQSVDPKKVLADPIVSGQEFGGQIKSFAQIQQAMSKLPKDSTKSVVQNSLTYKKADKAVVKGLQIISVPKTDYFIGPNVGDSGVNLPDLAYAEHRPSGHLLNANILNDIVHAKIQSAPLQIPVCRIPGLPITETGDLLTVEDLGLKEVETSLSDGSKDKQDLQVTKASVYSEEHNN